MKIISGEHRNATLAERHRSGLEKSLGVRVELVSRRNGSGQFSANGHQFYFRVSRRKTGTEASTGAQRSGVRLVPAIRAKPSAMGARGKPSASGKGARGRNVQAGGETGGGRLRPRAGASIRTLEEYYDYEDLDFDFEEYETGIDYGEAA